MQARTRSSTRTARSDKSHATIMCFVPSGDETIKIDTQNAFSHVRLSSHNSKSISYVPINVRFYFVKEGILDEKSTINT